MWLRDVDVPGELVDAHRRGDLVLFVGAGASRDDPSGLPDFRTLTAAIAQESQFPVPEDGLDRPDELLGDLGDNHQVDVHQRVAAHIGIAGSEPNLLHDAVGALALATPEARVVTTNYDLHLSAVLQPHGDGVKEYTAPALPMGEDFTGLVYLHGSLRQEPRALVVTDADFGRAYLRDAWAARFLERMFARYTVLFIGYSHNDVVMSYLARALGPDSPRFVLTDQPEAGHWRRLGITPVAYPVVDGSHAALGEAVAAWAALASMGLLEHRQWVGRLVAAAPSQVPEEASYLEAVIADPRTVGFFTEHARGPEWLAWAASRPSFQRLFEPGRVPEEGACDLAAWFAEHYVRNEEMTRQALSVVREAGGQLRLAVWRAEPPRV
jgi:SIR2-like domain